MTPGELALEQLLRSRWVHRPDPRPQTPASWGLAELAGRLVELSGGGAGAALTAAAGLVREAQGLGEPAAWITGPDAVYPPDLAEGGVDLASLAVIRAERGLDDALRAADRLLRSGAFGLVVLDLASFPTRRRGGGAAGAATASPELSLPAQTRLAAQAQRHDAALVCLTRKRAEADSLGSLISLHARAGRCALGQGRFAVELEVVKDKRRGPGWRHAEVCRGPAGLR